MGGDFKKIFGYILGLIYLGLGIFGYKYLDLETPYKELFAGVFIIYGIWRLYRAYTQI